MFIMAGEQKWASASFWSNADQTAPACFPDAFSPVSLHEVHDASEKIEGNGKPASLSRGFLMAKETASCGIQA